jgi:hypothetical protein
MMALPVWVLGCMLVFRLELWEARVLVGVNWVLNIGALFLALGLAGALIHAGAGWEGERPRPVLSRQQATDVEAIQALGGTYQVDEDSPGTPVVEVSLNGTKVTDADLAHLKSLTKLEALDLSSTAITDAGLANLEGLADLDTLYLDGTRVTDAGLAHLRGLSKLQSLRVPRTGVTDAGVRELQRALPQLKVARP